MSACVNVPTSLLAIPLNKGSKGKTYKALSPTKRVSKENKWAYNWWLSTEGIRKASCVQLPMLKSL